MILDLLTATCEEEDCKYEFITNSLDNLDCPSCGSENITGTWRKAVIFDTLSVQEIDSSKEITRIIAHGIEDIKDSINGFVEIKSMILDYLTEKGIDIPDRVYLKMDVHFDSSVRGDDYLSGVTFDGDDILSDEETEELRDIIDTNATIQQKLDNQVINMK